MRMRYDYFVRLAAAVVWAVLLVGGMGGCESGQAHRTAYLLTPEYPLLVPFAAQYQRAGDGGNSYVLASDVLPSSDALALYAPRFERVAYGPLQVGGVSAFREYTYDAQQISTPGNSGWRTRYVVREGVTFP